LDFKALGAGLISSLPDTLKWATKLEEFGMSGMQHLRMVRLVGSLKLKVGSTSRFFKKLTPM
jgi:hypothetical protein